MGEVGEEGMGWDGWDGGGGELATYQPIYRETPPAQRRKAPISQGNYRGIYLLRRPEQ